MSKEDKLLFDTFVENLLLTGALMQLNAHLILDRLFYDNNVFTVPGLSGIGEEE